MKVYMDNMKYLITVYTKVYKVYPLNIFIKLLYLPVLFSMYFFLWYSIGKNTYVDVEYMIMYYLITITLSSAYPFVYIANNIEKDVMEGSISNFLVRPSSYFIPTISKYFAWLKIYSITLIPIILASIYVNKTSFLQLVLFILYVIIGFMIYFFIWYNIGLCALFMERIKGLVRIAMTLIMFVSGSLVPLHIFPNYISKIVDFMPFRFFLYVPTNALLVRKSFAENLIDFSAGITWLIILILLSKLMWIFGIKKLSANMG